VQDDNSKRAMAADEAELAADVWPAEQEAQFGQSQVLSGMIVD